VLRFIKKSETFRSLDANLHTELGWKQVGIHLKTWQDLAVYSRIRKLSGMNIAEIGGGKSRTLPKLSGKNTCFNIDKFEGADGGPREEYVIPNVKNIKTFLGEFSPEIPDESLDVVYSVSVVEHVPAEGFDAFMLDTLRVLKPNGLCLHAIDMYVGTHVVPYAQERLDLYLGWIKHHRLLPLEPTFEQKALFRSEFVSNPDYTMWTWGQISQGLKTQRENTQSVSMIMGFRKQF
jgi:SAM-dependent methyltransferase